MTAAVRRTAGDGRTPAGLALLGVLAGVAAKAADESGWTAAADLGTYPAAWVLAVSLIGRFAPSPVTAAIRAAAFFAAMTLAYYAWAAWVLGFGWSALLPVWLVLAATAVAGVAALVQWATARPGVLPGAALALVAGVAVAEGGLRGLWLWAQGLLPFAAARPVQAVVEVAVVLTITLALPRHGSTRFWAAVLLVPMAWLAGELVGRLYGTGWLS
jgi:hypothetical protein